VFGSVSIKNYLLTYLQTSQRLIVGTANQLCVVDGIFWRVGMCE